MYFLGPIRSSDLLLALQHDEDQDIKIPTDDVGDNDDEDRMMNFAYGDDDDQG